MKIILATDGSPFSLAMVKEFAGRPLPINTKVKIISVYEADRLMNVAPMGVLTEYYDNANMNSLKFAEKSVAEAAEIIRNKNPELAVLTQAIEGVPKTVIVDEAEKFGADLIVLGSHGYGLVERLLLGSVSQSVALHAKCSVEIVRKKTK
ncbi:universal stress protein [Flavobacterium sp. LB3P45]|uniref:Universal stress protein n=1 Tax=Flavobacterium fructosi TaxID=3230416 RepID=A0ABW6HHL5_9FLAO